MVLAFHCMPPSVIYLKVIINTTGVHSLCKAYFTSDICRHSILGPSSLDCKVSFCVLVKIVSCVEELWHPCVKELQHSDAPLSA